MARAKFTLLSMMKDEGPYLIEWLAYHRLIGFDNICVYSNDCSDGSDAMLKRLEALGYLRHFENHVPEGKKPQPNALNLARRESAICDSDWLLAIDADEFVNIKTGDGSLTALFEAIDTRFDALMLTWRFYGSAGHEHWNPGLVIESYTRAAPDGFDKGWGVKTLFRPFEGMRLGIHRPHMRGQGGDEDRNRGLLSQRWLNGSGRDLPDHIKRDGWRSDPSTLGYDLVELSHYAVKSLESYLLRGIRGNVNNKQGKYDANYFAIFDRNEVEMPHSAAHAPEVKALMQEMLADPELNALYAKAISWHETRIAELRHEPDYPQRLAQLRDAAERSIGDLASVLFTHHLPPKYREVVQTLRAQGMSDQELAQLLNAPRLRARAKGQDLPVRQITDPRSADEIAAEILKRLPRSQTPEKS